MFNRFNYSVMNERQYNNPTFDDPKQCSNPYCEDGKIANWFTNDDGLPELSIEKCPYCDDNGHEIEE